MQVYVGDDAEAARDLMRPFLALYVGGMGSREQNFYNQLVQRYGFEDAAKEVQDLYLDGKKDEAMAALPDELIDAVSLCGPPDQRARAARRLPRRRRRHARRHADGVRRRRTGSTQLRLVAELTPRERAARPELTRDAGPARRVRRPRPRVPDDRARPRAARPAATR